MGIEPIQNGDAGWRTKVEDLLSYWSEGQGDGISSFGVARSRLNAVAGDMALPLIDASDATSVKRSKINALIAQTGIPDWADLYLDLQNQRYFRSSAPVDTHPQTILDADSAGVFSEYGVDVLPINDRGLLTTVTRTNLFLRSTAIGTSPWSTSTGGTIVTANDRTAPNGETEATKVDGAGVGSSGVTQTVTVSGGIAGKTFTVSALVYAETEFEFDIRTRGSGSTQEAQNITVTTAAGQWKKVSVTRSFSASADGTQLLVFIYTGKFGIVSSNVFWLWGAQLEEASFATDPILTGASAATKQGNRPRLEGLNTAFPAIAQGVGGVIAVDVLQPSVSGSVARVFIIHSGVLDNRLSINHNSGSFYLIVANNNTTQFSLNLGPWTEGRHVIAFAVSEGFGMARRVGGSLLSSSTVAWPTSMSMAAFGSTGLGTSENTYQRTERLGLNFGPQNADTFAQYWATAQEWAA